MPVAAPESHFKILQVISSAAASGAERHCVDLSIHLKGRGHTVEAAVPSGSWLAEELKEAGIVTHELHFKELSSVTGLRNALRGKRFDLIHSHLSRAAYACLAARISTKTPLVSTVHVRSGCLAYRLVGLSGGRVVAVSNYIRDVLIEHRVRDKDIRVVHNGTDFASRTYPDGPSFREELGMSDDRTLIGLVARLAREKGQHIAVEALNLLKDRFPLATLVFVGRNSQEEFTQTVKDRTKELGLSHRVIFAGMRSDIPRVIDSMDLTILPSEMEACPLTALESMSRGVPMVASARGGLIEMVADGKTGFLVPLTAEGLAEGLAKLLESPALLETFSHNSVAWVQEHFTNEMMLEGLERVYAEVVRKKS